MKKLQNTFRIYMLVIVIIAAPLLIFAQIRGVETISDTTDIKGQFEYLYRKSSRYQEYKVVLISGFNHIKENSLDSIRLHRGEIVNLQNEINKLNNGLSTQKNEIEKLSDDLKAALSSENSMSLFGMQITKGAYNLIMWAIIFILGVISAVVILLYKRGHQMVKSTKERLTEVQEEFETHRKNTLVREQKLARELMNVKLKYKSR